MEKKILLLTRVSTDRQEVEGQEKELIDYVKSLGFEEEEMEILPPFIGASAIKQNELYNQMLQSIQDKFNGIPTLKALAVWSLNRLGRNEKVLINLKAWFIENKIQLFAKAENFHLLKEDGSEDYMCGMMYNLLISFVQNDMKEKREKFHRSRVQNYLNSKYNGGVIPFGYMVDENGYIQVNPEEAKVIKELFERYATENISLKTLERDLYERGLFKTNTHGISAARYIRFIGYTGEEFVTKSQWHSHIKYPKIISRELFDICKSKREEKNTKVSRSRRFVLLSKLIKCPCCGYNMCFDKDIQGHYVAYCINNTKGTCSNNKKFRTLHIENKVLEMVGMIEANEIYDASKTTEDEFAKSLIPIQQKIESTTNRINEYKKKMEQLEDDYYTSTSMPKDRYEDLKAKLNSKLQGEILVRKEAETTLKKKTTNFQESKKNAYSVWKYFDNANINELPQEKKFEIIHKHIKEINYVLYDKFEGQRTIQIDAVPFNDKYEFPTIYYRPYGNKGKIWKHDDITGEFKCVDNIRLGIYEDNIPKSLEIFLKSLNMEPVGDGIWSKRKI